MRHSIAIRTSTRESEQRKIAYSKCKQWRRQQRGRCATGGNFRGTARFGNAVVDCCEHIGKGQIIGIGLATSLQMRIDFREERIALIILHGTRAVKRFVRRKVRAHEWRADSIGETRDGIPRFRRNRGVPRGLVGAV